MDIARIRSEVPVTRKVVYMNTGWSGPSPTRVTERVKGLLDLEMEEGPATLDAIARNHDVHNELTAAVAGLMNAPEESIALTQCTTHGIVIVVNGLAWKPGDEIVTCSLEHPSVMLPCLTLQESAGVKARIAEVDPKDDEETILSKMEDCMNENTRLVFLSHIQFSCGLRLPAKEIAGLAHQRGAYILLDGAQGAGQVVLDMAELDCDFYAMAGQKWLLGPDGTGALYVRKELIRELTPRYPAHGAAESFDVATATVVPNVESTRKFRISTTSTALEAGLAEAIAFNREVGPDVIEKRSWELAWKLQDVLRRIPGVALTSPEDPGLTSALTTFAVQGWEPRSVVEVLGERGIAARQVQTPPAVRLCTALFNTEDEIERVGSVLQEVMRL